MTTLRSVQLRAKNMKLRVLIMFLPAILVLVSPGSPGLAIQAEEETTISPVTDDRDDKTISSSIPANLKTLALKLKAGKEAKKQNAGSRDQEVNTWQEMVSYGLSVSHVNCDPEIPGRLYAVGKWYFVPEDCDSDGYWLPVRSDNYGKTWNLINTGLPDDLREVEHYDCELRKKYNGQFTLYFLHAGIVTSIYRSCDRGNTWQKVCDLDHGVKHFSVENNSDRMFAHSLLADCSTIKSDDGGQTWHQVYNSYGRDIYQFIPSPFDFNTVYAVGEVIGSNVLKSVDGGETWFSIVGSEYWWGDKGVYRLALHPTNPDVLFAVLKYGLKYSYPVKMTMDGGETWDDFGPHLESDQHLCSDMFIDPEDPNHMILASFSSNLKTLVLWARSERKGFAK
jgi:photosystem II stability/assembly factor-like uncharacterized protein